MKLSESSHLLGQRFCRSQSPDPGAESWLGLEHLYKLKEFPIYR